MPKQTLNQTQANWIGSNKYLAEAVGFIALLSKMA